MPGRDYRFLVNIDDCISDDIYGHFLYKDRSLKYDRLRLYSTSLENKDSFEEQMADIRSFINRSPHLIDLHQIIFTLSCEFSDESDWEHSLLYRLLNIKHTLTKVGVINPNIVNVDCSISIFVLYKVLANRDTNIEQTNYLNNRFRDECDLLSGKLNLVFDQPVKAEDLRNAYESYRAINEVGEALNDLIKGLLISSDAHGEVIIIDYIKENILKWYNINELFIVNNNESEKRCATFRTIDYITAELYESATQNVSFNDKCIETWKLIKALPANEIFNKYARIMKCYDADLSAFVRCVNNNAIAKEDESSEFASIEIPNDTAIEDNKSLFASDVSIAKKLKEPDELINSFKLHLPVKDVELKKGWGALYKALIDYSKDLRKKLKDYELALNELYLEGLRERQKETEEDRKKTFIVDDSLKQQMQVLDSSKTEVMKNLKQSQIAPDINIQNQLDLESKIELANEAVEFYIDCICSVRRKLCMMLILVLLVCVGILYFLFQPGSFGLTGITAAAIYMLAVFVIMTLFSSLPRIIYRGKIKSCLDALKEEITSDLENYKSNAKKLREFINYSNQLDYIERAIDIRTIAKRDFEQRDRARRYYLLKANEHHDRLGRFAGLIENYCSNMKVNVRSQAIYPRITGEGHVEDVVDCELFWPEDTGDR